jgi:glycosyltransferase involved in cell wall biosynthesis
MVETGGWGGIAHYAWNLCRALAEEGVDVVLLTNTRYELDVLTSPFRVEPCFDGAVGYVRTVGAFLHRLRALAPNIVHVQSLISTRFDALLWPIVRRRTPLVITAHNVRSHESTPWANWTAWRCMGTADAVIVHTEESARVTADRLRPGARIRVIRHGDYAFFAFDEKPSREEARRRLDLPRDGKLILAFGAIRPYKGIPELIAAMPDIRRHHPDAYLVVAGPLLVGSAYEYQQIIRQARVEAAVIFRPYYVPHEMVGHYFAAADVAVYNYHDVTDSGSLRIACSLLTPVVATTVGAFSEFLTDGVTARLIPPHVPERLVLAINGTLAHPCHAAGMAAAARALAASLWSWSDSAKATLDLYQCILDKRMPRRSL